MRTSIHGEVADTVSKEKRQSLHASYADSRWSVVASM